MYRILENNFLKFQKKITALIKKHNKIIRGNNWKVFKYNLKTKISKIFMKLKERQVGQQYSKWRESNLSVPSGATSIITNRKQPRIIEHLMGKKLA